MRRVFWKFGLRQDAVVLKSSSQTYKHILAARICSCFCHTKVGGSWTRTAEGQLQEGRGAAAGAVGGGPPVLLPSREVAAGRGVDVAVLRAAQVSIRSVGGKETGQGACGRQAEAPLLSSRGSL